MWLPDILATIHGFLVSLSCRATSANSAHSNNTLKLSLVYELHYYCDSVTISLGKIDIERPGEDPEHPGYRLRTCNPPLAQCCECVIKKRWYRIPHQDQGGNQNLIMVNEGRGIYINQLNATNQCEIRFNPIDDSNSGQYIAKYVIMGGCCCRILSSDIQDVYSKYFEL